MHARPAPAPPRASSAATSRSALMRTSASACARSILPPPRSRRYEAPPPRTAFATHAGMRTRGRGQRIRCPPLSMSFRSSCCRRRRTVVSARCASLWRAAAARRSAPPSSRGWRSKPGRGHPAQVRSRVNAKLSSVRLCVSACACSSSSSRCIDAAAVRSRSSCCVRRSRSWSRHRRKASRRLQYLAYCLTLRNGRGRRTCRSMC